MTPENEGTEVRLDVWLWRARFFRTRAMATEFVTRKGIRLTRHGQTRKTDKPGTRLQAGDILTFFKAKDLISIEFISAGLRRGPASEAQGLYRPAPASEIGS